MPNSLIQIKKNNQLVEVAGAPVGIFATTSALQTAFPAASHPGKLGLVGSAAPYGQYISNGQSWALAGASAQQMQAGAVGVVGVTSTGGMVGPDGAPVSGDVSVALAASPDILIVGSITRDANGAATAAAVVWPDGATGVYTATAISSAFPGAVDAYTVTKGGATYTQPAVTRNASGAVINRPAMTVA